MPSGATNYTPWQSQLGLYGYTTDSTMDAVTYSAKLHLRVVAPLATLAGVVYKGSFRLSQWVGGTGTALEKNSVTIAQLIQMSTESSPSSSDFILTSAVVNDYTLVDNLPATTTASFKDVLSDSDLGAEIVSYAVLMDAALPTVTATVSPPVFYYSLAGDVVSSASVQVFPTNLLLYRAFKSIVPHKQERILDFSYTGPVDPEQLPPPTTAGETEIFAKILPIAEGIIPQEAMNTPYQMSDTEEEKEGEL